MLVDDVWQLWDVAGDRDVTPPFPQVATRNAAIIMLCYRDAATLIALQMRWMAYVDAELKKRAPVIVIVAALIDDARDVDAAAVAWAMSHGAHKHLVVTVHSQTSITETFEQFRNAIDVCATQVPLVADDCLPPPTTQYQLKSSF